jgi:hypothetical protein
MKIAGPIGPAVHVGPYRNFFNRDITIAIPYDNSLASDKAINVYVYNHVTGDWDEIPVDRTTSDLVLFKTKVLGLFRAGS